jgi:site-specific recombinase XerD
MNALTPLTPSRELALPAAELETAKAFAQAEKAAATRRAYRTDFDLFRAWCEPRGVSPLPASPESVAAFLAAEASRGIKPSSIGRRVAAIRYAHRLAGCDTLPTDSEAVRATVRGIRRTVGAAKARKAPIMAETVRSMAQAAPDTPAGITEGAIFRPVPGEVAADRLRPRAVANIVKNYAKRLGLPISDFSAHSLRSGFLTSAARRGASVFKMRDVSRHKSMDVLQGYVRDAELFHDHAGAGLL